MSSGPPPQVTRTEYVSSSEARTRPTALPARLEDPAARQYVQQSLQCNARLDTEIAALINHYYTDNDCKEPEFPMCGRNLLQH